jgi:hypothetical protein
MSTITKVIDNQGEKKDKVYVYIDNTFCTYIRQRTWLAMNLQVGSTIDCNNLKILENNFWKKLYGPSAWEREKIRIDRVIQWFSTYIPDVDIIPVGLGTDSNAYFENIHSKEKGEPDLSIRAKGFDIEIMALEVSGTEKIRESGYWVRSDKIDYIKNHPERDIWIVLHYQLPKERFIWLKINKDKSYPTQMINVKGAGEHYVIFHDSDPEICSSLDFKNHVLTKIQN